MSRLLLGNDRQAERATQQRLQTRIANASSRAFSNEIRAAMEAGARAYARDGDTLAITAALAEHAEKMERLLLAEWSTALRIAGDRVLGATKCAHGVEWVRKNEPQADFWVAAQAWLASRSAPIATLTAATTANDLRRRVNSGMARGLSVPDIADEILAAAPALSVHRGMRIARTESHGAYQAGHQFSAEASALDIRKEWVSASDERTRDGENEFDHIAADGETVDLLDYFTLTGEPLQYPGDDAGSAANVIHCRCGRVDVLH